FNTRRIKRSLVRSSAAIISFTAIVLAGQSSSMFISSAIAAPKATFNGSALTRVTSSPSALSCSCWVMVTPHLASLDDLQKLLHRGLRHGVEPRHATTNHFRSVRFDNRTRRAPKLIELVGVGAVERHRRVIDRQDRNGVRERHLVGIKHHCPRHCQLLRRTSSLAARRAALA